MAFRKLKIKRPRCFTFGTMTTRETLKFSGSSFRSFSTARILTMPKHSQINATFLRSASCFHRLVDHFCWPKGTTVHRHTHPSLDATAISQTFRLAELRILARSRLRSIFELTLSILDRVDHYAGIELLTCWSYPLSITLLRIDPSHTL